MLRFNRLARLTVQARFLQQLATRVASTSAARAPANSPLEKVILSAEQLQSKYKGQLKTNQMETIYDVIERIELSGEVLSGRILDRATRLIVDSPYDLTSLTDRQISQILSAFGERSDSVSKQKRSKHLSDVLTTLKSKGVALGPLSRTAAFTARVDNREIPSVVEELQALEAAGMAPTADILQQFAKVYAQTGNTKGIIDIMTHMKSSEMTVNETVVGALVYSLATSGQAAQAEEVVKKFTGILNEVALRCALGEGIIKFGDLDRGILKVASIPPSARLNHFDNQRYILHILCNLIEQGVPNAFMKFSTVVETAEDGKTVNERSNNAYLLSRARAARSEGKLSVALDIYSLVHPKYHNSIFEEKAISGFVEFLKSGKKEIKEILSLFEKVERFIPLQNEKLNSKLFFLESALGTANWERIFQELKKDLPEILSTKPELKMSLSKELSRELIRTDISVERRTEVIANIATILFTKTGVTDPEDAYTIIYALSGHDVEYIIGALKIIKDERVKREATSAAVRQALQARDDPLKYEKLEKLVNSDAVTSINITKVQQQIEKLIRKKEESRFFHLAAKIISLAFLSPNSRSFEFSYGPKFVQGLICNKNISTEHLRKLVDQLEHEPKVRLSRDDVASVKSKLVETNLSERVELVERLKAQGQTYARWMASSVSSLEEELNSMMTNESVKPNVIHKLQEVILQKLLQKKNVDQVLVNRLLRSVSQRSDAPSRLKKLEAALWEKTFKTSLREANDDTAGSLWEIKTSFSPEAALSYISLLFVKGKTTEADGVCRELLTSAQTITGGALESAGRTVSSYDVSKVDDLAKYLKQKLNLREALSRRIVSQIKAKQLKALIDKGELEAALQLAVEETSATGFAFGQHELFKASFIQKNPALTEKTYKMVMNAHDKTIAILDLVFAMLEQGITQHASNLLQTRELKISPKKLEFFVNRAVDMNRPDMLRTLFFGLHSNNAASTIDLNKLLLQLAKIYYKNNAFTDLETLEKELKEISFPTEQYIKKVFEMQHQKKGVTAEK